MTAYRIPLTAIPAQTINVQLGGQSARLTVYQKRTGLYLDLTVGGAAVVTGALCRDRCKIVRGTYQGFTGDLAFIDTQGTSDPEYSGLGARFDLVWLP